MDWVLDDVKELLLILSNVVIVKKKKKGSIKVMFRGRHSPVVEYVLSINKYK